MTRAAKPTARWCAWDWTGLVLASASVTLLVLTLATGDSWPGSEVVLVLGLVGAGLGAALMFGPRDRGTAEVDDAEEAK